MQDYEIITIFKPDYAPEALSTLHDLVVMVGGETERERDEGVKLLTYPIVKDGEEYTDGCYTSAEIKLPKDKLWALERETSSFPTVLRYLIVKNNK